MFELMITCNAFLCSKVYLPIDVTRVLFFRTFYAYFSKYLNQEFFFSVVDFKNIKKDNFWGLFHMAKVMGISLHPSLSVQQRKSIHLHF